VIVPDDADEQQADESKTDPNLFADPQFAGKLVHLSLLAGETDPRCGQMVVCTCSQLG
jgi:hypothetical protein